MFRNFIWSLLLFVSFSSYANALEVDMSYSGRVEFSFDTGNYDSQAGNEGTNWVGVYKTGSSNDWDNILQWSWVKDLVKHDYSNKIRYMKLDHLNEGSYDVRFFENNSYDILASISFTKNAQANALKLTKVSQNRIGVTIRDINLLADDTWIAVFHKGDANEWNNVIDWNWCKNGGPGSAYHDFNTLNYTSGTYEVRLFLNNSYTPVGSVEFTKEGGAETPKLSVASINSVQINFKSTYTDDGKSWVGIFKHGDESNSGNLLLWTYVTSNNTFLSISFLEAGSYDLRLFYNDSYDVEAEVTVDVGDKVFIDTPFDINDNNNLKKIRYMHGTPLNDNDWLAIFKKGDEHITDNVRSWTYVGNDLDVLNVHYTNINVQGLENGEYDLVYFLYDSYEQHGLTGKIIVDR